MYVFVQIAHSHFFKSDKFITLSFKLKMISIFVSLLNMAKAERRSCNVVLLKKTLRPAHSKEAPRTAQPQ